MTIAIRPMQAADVPGVARLLPDLGYAAGEAELAARFAALRAWPDQEVFVADDGGPLLGSCHVHGVRLLHTVDYAEVQSLVVAASCQGRGVGRALLACACEWAFARGYPRVRLRSGLQREGAHAFYLAQGFAVARASVGFERWRPGEGPR
jgi:GNAT superfamily N-acetyltransferase